MEITIDLKTLLLGLLIIAIIVLVIYLIVAVANLIKSLKSLSKVLDDFQVVSDIAAARSKQIDHVVNDVATTVSGATSQIKDNQGIIKSLQILVGAIIAIKNVVSKNNEKKATTGKPAPSKK